jgi:hypothetical protein
LLMLNITLRVYQFNIDTTLQAKIFLTHNGSY